MTTRLDHALALAADGFYVFPLKPGQKTPAHKGWQAEATRDPAQIRGWFDNTDFNIGIFTGRFSDNEALVVVDVDNKEGKNGDAELVRLELVEGLDLPETRETYTPTGGRHVFFRVDEPVKSGVNTIARGLDVRSRGGYVVGAGSRTKNGEYLVASGGPNGLARAPKWLLSCLHSRAAERRPDVDIPVPYVEAAPDRARRYLEFDAPAAQQGDGGDETTFRVACRLKDIGCTEQQALAILLEHWNHRCSPPWDPDELRTKVRNAYAYGTLPAGVAAPENDFDAVVNPLISAKPAEVSAHPFDELNKEFAYVVVEGKDHILWERKNALVHLDINTFHRMLAAREITVGKKTLKVTQEWIASKNRRSYDEIVFAPGRTVPPKFYNLWRGFGIEPISDAREDARKGVDMWMEHARLNVCQGDVDLFSWLLGYFGHLVQRPWEKPSVALVLKGDKGVGKNQTLAPFSAMLGNHYLLTANRRYLVGNFNGHLENLLLFVLDEAFWSGDKQAEGTLKDLITGDHHLVEHKGDRPYKVANKTRVVIIGNEDWIVPASGDERRFAVFNVGDGRKQDTAFFGEMDRCMKAGGAGALLYYLQNIRTDNTNVHQAPSTVGLLDQKHASLDPFQAWWLSCLTEGKIVLSDFGEDWPGEPVECERLRGAFRRWAKERNVRGRLPDDRTIGRDLSRLGVEKTRKFKAGYVYEVPALADARAAWDRFIGHSVEWPE